MRIFLDESEKYPDYDVVRIDGESVEYERNGSREVDDSLVKAFLAVKEAYEEAESALVEAYYKEKPLVEPERSSFSQMTMAEAAKGQPMTLEVARMLAEPALIFDGEWKK